MSALSNCPTCGEPGRYGFDDDWCHETLTAALACPREGWTVDDPEPVRS